MSKRLIFVFIFTLVSFSWGCDEEIEKLSMPEAEKNGFVRTLNNMGYMTSSLDSFSRAFVEFSTQAPGSSLDIGAAYGVATLAALESGARVIANDIDARHLLILKERVKPELHSQLTLLPGAFPDEIDLKESSLGAILVCRVLHFFDGPAIQRAVNRAYQWLKPGGKLIVVAETPYLKNFQSFIPIYEKRIADKAEWPGYIDDVMAIAPERGKSLPKTMHLLDPEVLTRVFKKAGFEVEKAETFARPEFPVDIQLDGRESVGIIGIKK